MVDDSSKPRRKVPITEEEMSDLLERYPPEMVLTLLQEVSQNAAKKIDWNELVKNTNTGITSAREYQMLWRHLAYGHDLIDLMDDDAETPLDDDDSDLEIEWECLPPVSREASAEAAAYVKVLMRSGCLNDPNLPTNLTIEAPVTINVPDFNALTASPNSTLHACAIPSKNIVISVTVEKQQLSSGISADKRPNNETTGVNIPSRRKRRGWSTEEDMKLTAAVQKYGEHNWANIESGDFQNDRKAAELSQRWSNLKKKQFNSNIGSSSQLTESQLAAAHRAMSIALDMPMADNSKISSQIGGTKSQHQPQKVPISPLEQLGTEVPPKPQVKTDRPSWNPVTVPDSKIKATAIAAGACIATPADAASLMEAACSQNVVHIKTGVGNSMIKSSPTKKITNQLPTNVHFLRDGLAKAPISSHAAGKPNISRPGEAQGHCIMPLYPAVQQNPVGKAPILKVPSGPPKTAENSVLPTPVNEIRDPVKSDPDAADKPSGPLKTAVNSMLPTPVNEIKVTVKSDPDAADNPVKSDPDAAGMSAE